jgi:hypothetical protein
MIVVTAAKEGAGLTVVMVESVAMRLDAVRKY